jgi:hypothetical protein
MSHAQVIALGGLIFSGWWGAGTPQDASGGSSPSPSVYEVSQRSRFELVVPHQSATLEQALSDYAALGYKLLVWSGYLLFEKPPDKTHPLQYLVLRSADSAAFERDLNQAGARGFRLVDKTLFDHVNNHARYSEAGGTPGPLVLGGIMEKRAPESSFGPQGDPQLGRQYEYRIVQDESGSIPKFERRIRDVASTGYRPVAIERFASFDRDGTPEGRPKLVAVLERTRSGAAMGTVAADRFKVVAAKHSNIERHLVKWRASGYSLALIQTDSILVMEKSPQASSSEYLVIRPTGYSPTSPGPTLRRDMNQAASRGFRLRPRSLFLSSTRGLLWTRSVGAIMEKPADPGTQPEYLVLDAFRESTLRKELESALAEGFVPIDMMSVPGSVYIVLERPRGLSEVPKVGMIGSKKTARTRTTGTK